MRAAVCSTQDSGVQCAVSTQAGSQIKYSTGGNLVLHLVMYNKHIIP